MGKRTKRVWKSEDLKTKNKPIYNICLDGEEKSSKRRIFSKIFQLDKNNQYGFAMTKPLQEKSSKRRIFSKIFQLDKINQYGFAMTKPLPISIFKKEVYVNMEILNKSMANFDPKR